MMIRRGSKKFVWSEPDGAQLFDLAVDPHELTNLALDHANEAEVTALEAEIHERWDVARIHAEVLANQRNRRAVDGALRRGRHTPWDFQPGIDAANQYMRNHLDLNDVEAGRRTPN